MRILRIYIENLNSLQDRIKIDFTESPLAEAGLFAIVGDTGAGKTTILDAMTLALYGKMARIKQKTQSRQLHEVMSYGTTESVAEVEFATAQGIYRAKWTIWRSRGKVDGNMQGPNQELSRYDEESGAFKLLADKKREFDELVERVSGLDYERFKRSVLLAQGEFAAFLDADERERSELLERITGTAIYTDLSMAAFQRHKQEREQLEALHNELDRLDILGPEAVAVLENEQKELAASAKTVRTTIQSLQQARERWQQKRKLTEQLETLRIEKDSLLQQQMAQATDRELLKKHQQLDPVATELDQLERQEAEVAELDQTLTAFAENIAEQTASQQELLKTLRANEKAWEDFQRAAEVEDKLLEEVSRLDQRIVDLQADIVQPRSVLAKAKENYQEQALQQERDSSRLREIQSEVVDLQQRIEANARDATLGDRLGRLEKDIENWRQRQEEAAAAAKRYEHLAAVQKSAAAIERKLKQKVDRDSQQLEQWKTEFNRELPPNEATDRLSILNRINQTIEQLTERQNDLQKLYDLAQEYQRYLAEHTRFTAQLEELEQERQSWDKQVLDLEDQTGYAEQELNYRQELYHQQKLIADYAKDRQNLAEGEPCPLCFSEVHPFRSMDLKPFVDETKREYERARNHVTELQDKRKRYFRQQQQLTEEITHIQGQRAEETGGQLARLDREIENLELKIARINLDDAELTGGQPGLELLDASLQKNQAEIARYRQRNRQLNALAKRMDETERLLKADGEALAKARAEREGLDGQLQQQLTVRNTVQERVSLLHEQLQSQLTDQGIRLADTTASAALARLQQRLAQYRSWSEQLTGLAKERDTRAARTASNETHLQSAKLSLTRQQQELTQQEQKIAALEKERQEKFGAASVTERRAARQREQNQRQQQLAEQQQAMVDLDRQLASTQRLAEADTRRREKLTWQMEKSRTRLSATLTGLDIADIAMARAARLPTERVASIRTAEAELAQKLAEVSRLERERSQEWKTLKSSGAADADLIVIEEEWQTRTRQLDDINQQLGRLREKLTQHTARAQQAEVLLRQIVGQKKETARWAQLDELIGQADGKKFRTFAQGLTLQKLTVLANRHLQQLNGRYLIEKKVATDLDLEIIDTYQADNRRAMYSLSGGESFLVSLALALGLSDLAGRDTRIHSLFIDEGFGTLDENSLDLAITTLENLQADGKTIGIISHVKALKERIGTQIRVIKRAGGRSVVEIA